MEKQVEWKKKNIPLVKLNKEKGVESIEGIYLKRRDAGEFTDTESGEVRERFTLIFQSLKNKEEKFQVWENAGLRNAIEMNDVQEGEAVRIVHLGKVERSGGKPGTVNQYDVFTLN